jgi:hypothetical protein
MDATQPIPAQIAKKLKAAAATPVKDGNTMPRQIAVDRAIAWCKYTFPEHFQGEGYEPPKSNR